jgi:hypothetical protein
MEKCGIARQAANKNIMLRRKDAIWMPDNKGKNIDTQS